MRTYFLPCILPLPSLLFSLPSILPQTLVKQLPTQDGPAMMLIGSFVAECASVGLEWIYAQEQLQQKLEAEEGSLSGLLFRDPPECPLFSYAVGKQGFYHEQVQSFRRCLVQVGSVSPEDQAQAYAAYYQDTALRTDRNTAADITEKYIDRLTKTFMQNLKDGKPWSECGIDQFEAQSLCKVPTLVARHTGDLPTLLVEVKRMVRIWQIDEGCAVATLFCSLTARVLDHVLRTRCSPNTALEHFFALAHEKEGDEVESLSAGEMKVLQTVEILESVMLHKIQDIESVLALNKEASDRQKLRVFTVLSRALLTSGIGDGTEAHYRRIIAGVKLEAADKDMWMKCKEMAKEARWVPPAREKLSATVAAKLLGISCDVHGTFFNMCYLLQTCSSYQQAVQTNILLGGDSCARAVLLGAFFAAPIYPLAPENEPLLFCAGKEESRPLSGGGDEGEDRVSRLRATESWVPIDWLVKCDATALAEVVSDAEVLTVARSEVLIIGGGTSRLSHAINSVLARGRGQPCVRVANVSLSSPAQFQQHIHANTRSILVMGGEPSEEPTPVMLTALQALEACGTTAPVIVMSLTAVKSSPK